MKPYYQDEFVTLYHGDAQDVLHDLGDPGGLALITDPPYGFGAYPTDISPHRNLFKHWVGHHKVVAWFGYPEDLVALCVRTQLEPNEWITWCPSNGSMLGGSRSSNKGLARASEAIAVFGPGQWADLNRERTGAMHLYRSPKRSRARLHDVWTEPSPGLGVHHRKRQHPNEKPVGLMRHLVLALADDLVLDPYAGSGTTLRAAKDLGRRAIGIEIEERWCELAAQRLSQEVLVA